MQQKAVVVFSQSNESKSQDLREISPAINHLFVVTRGRRNKWKEHLQKERQRQDKLHPVTEEEEDRERGHVDKHVNEHVNSATEHLVGLFKGAATDDGPSRDRDHEENLVANVDAMQSSTNEAHSSKSSTGIFINLSKRAMYWQITITKHRIEPIQMDNSVAQALTCSHGWV